MKDDGNLRQRGSAAAKASSSSSTTQDQVPAKELDEKYSEGTNWVTGGVEDNPYLFAIVVLAPFISLLLAYFTSPNMVEEHPDLEATRLLTQLVPACFQDVKLCASGVYETGVRVLPIPPATEAVQFLASFFGMALVLDYVLPGPTRYGPETLTGHVPAYCDNGVLHCIVSTVLFWAASNLGYGTVLAAMVGDQYKEWLPVGYDFGIMYDVFLPTLAFLNLFGMVFCAFLTVKGLYFPSTQDSGTSGSLVKDYLWGTELYPRIGWLDLKRFINCRFSMSFWQLAGLSYCYKSYTLHGSMDWGLFFAAISQYLYLFKFFLWEMGYMRSIDIIVDRAGFEIQWGCLVWVPAVYTFHSRFCVLYPTQLTFPVALGLFLLSMTGVILNYLADRERDVFRATNGKALVWGKPPKYIKAQYTTFDRKTGKETTKTSLLLASGFWGVARHFQYFFELTAAYSWCFLANPLQNGVVVMLYAVFLTCLLIDRANRDSEKCHLKYGKGYEEYCKLVPYKILPGIY